MISPRSLSTMSTARSSTRWRRCSARPIPLPAGLTEDIKFALTVQAMHAEVAELQRLGAESALARSEYTRTQTMTFSAETLSVMVTLSPIDADEVRVDGWVTGHDSPVVVEIRGDAHDRDHRGRR